MTDDVSYAPSGKLTDEERAEHLWRGLSACMGLDPKLTVATVTHWLEHHGARMPDVAGMDERTREQARFWAATANQQELEVYLVACVMELEYTPITNRAAKRLGAFAYRMMNLPTQEAFAEWIFKQEAERDEG